MSRFVKFYPIESCIQTKVSLKMWQSCGEKLFYAFWDVHRQHFAPSPLSIVQAKGCFELFTENEWVRGVGLIRERHRGRLNLRPFQHSAEAISNQGFLWKAAPLSGFLSRTFLFFFTLRVLSYETCLLRWCRQAGACRRDRWANKVISFTVEFVGAGLTGVDGVMTRYLSRWRFYSVLTDTSVNYRQSNGGRTMRPSIASSTVCPMIGTEAQRDTDQQ